MSDGLPLIGVIAKLQLAPGDIVLVKPRHPVSMETADRIQKFFAPMLPHENKVVILNDLDIEVLSPTSSREVADH
jgi:hypothetical protein